MSDPEGGARRLKKMRSASGLLGRFSYLEPGVYALLGGVYDYLGDSSTDRVLRPGPVIRKGQMGQLRGAASTAHGECTSTREIRDSF